MATKYTRWPQNIPNGHKIYQMATKYTKWPQNIPNGHKIYQIPNWYFCFENIPSGNPESNQKILQDLTRQSGYLEAVEARPPRERFLILEHSPNES
jgi:hypothetical protein